MLRSNLYDSINLTSYTGSYAQTVGVGLSLEHEMDEKLIDELDRAAARDFLLRDRDRRYAKARKLTKFQKNVIAEAKSLGNYARSCETRTFCILIGSFMEDILKSNFIEIWSIEKSKYSEFFGSNGPLSTFSQRLTIASGLNWLSPNLRKDADLLRKIRNEMAHNHKVHSLTQEPLLSWANDITKFETTWNRNVDGRYAKAYEVADHEKRLRVRVFSAALTVLSAALSNPRLIENSLPPGYHEKGWKGLTDVTKGLFDIIIGQAYLSFGISPSASIKNSKTI